jgi:hypothetical protein
MSSKSMILLVSLCAILAPSAAHPATKPENPTAAELEARVPELVEFHEVIFQLWHKAWPDKDYEMMKELLPAVRDGIRDLGAAELPGILRDKTADWDKGVQALEETLQVYGDAAARDDGPALLKAVETLHAQFEGLAHLIRPVMAELEAYHRVLYGIFHYYMPERNLEKLRHASGELISKCGVLSEAPVPERCSANAEALEAGIDRLCDLSRELQATAAAGDWEPIDQAVDRVHDQYRKVKALF